MTHDGVLVLRGGALGDFVLSFPHLFALQNRFGSLVMATHAKYIPFLKLAGLGSSYLPLERAETTRLLYADPPDVFDGVVSWLKRGPEHPTAAGRRFSVFVSGAAGANSHVADAYWKSLEPLGVQPMDPPDLRSRFRVSTDRPSAGITLVVHPGSGGDWKRWPLQYYLDLARSFVESRAVDQVHILVGPEDESWAGELSGISLPGPVSVFESGDLLRTVRLLASASLYIGNDSGVTHLSALLGVPTVAIHGPTSPLVWGARGKRVRHVFDKAGCSENGGEDVRSCSDPTCLRKVTPGKVFQAAMALAGDPTTPNSR